MLFTKNNANIQTVFVNTKLKTYKVCNKYIFNN